MYIDNAVCMYVCVHICIHTHTCTYTRMHTQYVHLQVVPQEKIKVVYQDKFIEVPKEIVVEKVVYKEVLVEVPIEKVMAAQVSGGCIVLKP